MAEIGRELQNAIGSLDTGAWDGRSRARAEPLLGRVRPESGRVQHQLEELGYKLMRVANIFEQEDDTAARELEGMGWVEFEDGSYVTDLTSARLKTIDRIAGKIDDAQDVWEIFASVGIAAGLVKGSTYAGQTIFYGSRDLKDWAGVSSYLTHIKDTNIPSYMTKHAFKGKFSRGSILLEGISEAAENWEEFEGDTSKVATGIVVETALGIGCSAVGAAGGAFVVGAIGGAILGPPGAVIGGKIGGVMGGWAGGKFAEWVEDWKVGDDGQELDQLVVETVDEKLDTFANSIARLFD
ncbi:MAG: hypothetical protein DRJ03_26460 [Chloroflexi bacterium]|nr:MAG: hypothetical protein DRJ03_26460 [Chloroflexota bacterium]